MKKFIKKPQFFFIFLAILVLITGLIHKEGAIKLALYGTYIDLKSWSVCLFSSFFFILIAVNYASLTITQRTPKKVLTILHIVLQIVALIPLLYYIYSSDASTSYDEVSRMNIILILAFTLFIIATIIHLINFAASLLAKKD